MHLIYLFNLETKQTIVLMRITATILLFSYYGPYESLLHERLNGYRQSSTSSPMTSECLHYNAIYWPPSQQQPRPPSHLVQQTPSPLSSAGSATDQVNTYIATQNPFSQHGSYVFYELGLCIRCIHDVK